MIRYYLWHTSLPGRGFKSGTGENPEPRVAHTILALFHVSGEERSTHLLRSTNNFLAGTKRWFKRPQVLASIKLNSCALST